MKSVIRWPLLVLVLSLAAFILLPMLVRAEPQGDLESQGENNCLECHKALGGRQAEVAEEWQGSIHAARGVDCVACHGGDPSADDADQAMSLEADFLGSPLKSEIPDLCASCHADPQKMALYELPTDQLQQYRQESVHGQLLAQGDQNVATCYDCHGGHNIREVNDPTSTVFPTNLPGTCAKCHGDASLMEPYGIPTYQYALYKDSVHGKTLLNDHNTKAPTCATCHSNHGASLPGYTQVVEVCGSQCHPAVQDAYLSGSHRSGALEGSEAPRCVTCHGRYDVKPATLDLFLGDQPRHCRSCHQPSDPAYDTIQAIFDQLSQANQAVSQAERAMASAQTIGLSLNFQKVQLQKAKSLAMEAKVLQHAVQLQPVMEKTITVKEISASIVQTVEKASTLEGSYESRALIAATGVIIVVSLGLFIILRRP